MPPTRTRLKAVFDRIRNPAWLCFLWAGLTAGISLLEAPVKFTAPTLTREVALDVGRVVFQALNRVELALLILLLVLVRVSDRTKDYWAWCAVLALIMIAQSAWLLPELSQRAESIVGGVEPGPSIAHGAYAVSEIAKLVTLLLLGFRLMPEGPRAP
ncbi:MAG: hypothetical protein R3315_06065 [Woeseiaceae bacterium]|nr:hypothetical protein [Woeseiaceae bacterium]